ncbi:armadillo-type protein [Gaertneriomyces semiglobifer]|nr:armadillo-type protein [Gaertneriomyces semiglobifer]
MMGELAVAKAGHIDPAVQQAADEVVQLLQRDLNILSESSSDRNSKRRALEKVKKETIANSALKVDHVRMRLVFTSLCKILVRLLGDNVEKCRELSAEILMGFTDYVDDITPFLAYIVPTIGTRLGQKEIIEPSEELRLLLVHTLVRLVQLSQAGFAPFVEGTVTILQRTLQDPFPDVKKESCKLVGELARHTSRAVAYHGAAIAKALVYALHHRHSNVRTAGLHALRDAIIVDATGLDDVLEVLFSLRFDKSQSVREQLYATFGEWMLNMPDRWSLSYKLLPVLLSGLSDDIPQIRDLCKQYMDRIGQLYETEWEDRVKDELDYVQDKAIATGRPRVGCRYLLRDNTQKIVTKAIEGLTDWNSDVRVKAAQVLASLIYYAEDQLTGYTGAILAALYRVLAGDEEAVMKASIRVAELLGAVIDPNVYLDVVLPAIRTGGGGSTPYRIGCLRVLAGLVRGTSMTGFTRSHLERITEILNERDQCQNENTEVLVEVASVVTEVVNKLPRVQTRAAGHTESLPEAHAVTTIEDIGRAGYDLFVASAQLMSIPGDDSVPGSTQTRQKATEALQCLATSYGLFGIQDVYAYHFDKVISDLAGTLPEWNKYVPHRRLFDTVITQAGFMVGQRLDMILPFFTSMVQPERDYEVRQQAFDLLLRLLQNPAQTLNYAGNLPAHTQTLLSNLILPCGVWRAGKKAALLRGKAMELLAALLVPEGNSQECVGLMMRDVLEKAWETDLMNVLVGTLEDDEKTTRETSVQILDVLFQKRLDFKANTFKTMYVELLKRLDDAHDSLRIRTANTFRHFFDALAAWAAAMEPLRVAGGGSLTVLVDGNGNVGQQGELVEVGLDDVHWSAIVKGLTVHMDDVNSALQESIFRALQAGLPVIPHKIVTEHLSSVRERHRNPRYIDALLKQAHNNM